MKRLLVIFSAIFIVGCATIAPVPVVKQPERQTRTSSVWAISTSATIRTIGFFGDTHMDSVNTALGAIHAAIAQEGISRMLADGAQRLVPLGDIAHRGYCAEHTQARDIFAPFGEQNIWAVAGNHDPEDTRLSNPWYPFWERFETYHTSLHDDSQARLRLINWWSAWNATPNVSDSTAIAQRLLLDYFCRTTPDNWLLVIAQHYPAYSQIVRGGAQPVQQDWFIPQIANRYKVDLLLSGHCHGGPEVYSPAAGKPIYVVSGGGGMELSTVALSTPYSFFYLNAWRDAGIMMRHHYGLLRVSDDGIDVSFVSITAVDGPGGQLLYQFFVPRQAISRGSL